MVSSTSKLHDLLDAIIERAAINGPAGLQPASAPVHKLDIIPFLAAVSIAFPCRSVNSRGIFANIRIQLPAAYIANAQLLKHLEQLLIKKSAVQLDDDRDIHAIRLPDFADDMAHHLLNGVTVVAVLLPTTEHHVDDKPAPDQLERLEPVTLFIGGLNAMTLLRVIIVKYHRIKKQFDHLRFRQPQPPDE